jgi:LIVCS family branched-chain amino acid:cation transporter
MSRKTNDVIWVGLALFAMFFGAGNLIFPPFLGFLAGAKWSIALVGFLITGIGMPLMGIMASARAGGSVEYLADRVSPWFGRLLSMVIILAIGPLLAIPRTAATTFEIGVRPNLPSVTPALASVVYFAITLYFALNRKKVIDKIGKILTPFLLVTLALIILKGIFRPLGEAVGGTLTNSFGSGFREGYQTMDTLASVVFAEIIIATMIFKGYRRISDQVKMTSLAGVIAAAGLGLVYGGLAYLGATAVSLFPGDVERTNLLIGIAQGLLGNGGKVALGLAVSLACLTTSIGLTATVGDYFSNLSWGKLRYKAVCIATCVFSAVFATVGVTTIVRVAVPLLVTVYPIAIVLILLTMMGRLVKHRAIYAGAVVGAFSTSLFDAFTSAGLPIEAVNHWISFIPFAKSGFPWILPAVAGGIIGLILAKMGIGGRISEPAVHSPDPS